MCLITAVSQPSDFFTHTDGPFFAGLRNIEKIFRFDEEINRNLLKFDLVSLILQFFINFFYINSYILKITLLKCYMNWWCQQLAQNSDRCADAMTSRITRLTDTCVPPFMRKRKSIDFLIQATVADFLISNILIFGASASFQLIE